MKNKSLILLLVVAISFLSQPLLRQIVNDYHYYAADSLKNLLLVVISFFAIYTLHKKNHGSILLVAFMMVNIAIYPTNLLLLDDNTYLYGVGANANHAVVELLRWKGSFNLSSLYTAIELAMIVQGIWSVGIHYFKRVVAWIRLMRSYTDIRYSHNRRVSKDL